MSEVAAIAAELKMPFCKCKRKAIFVRQGTRRQGEILESCC